MGAGAGACLLVEEALENWTGRAVGDEVSFLSAKESAWWSSIHLPGGEAFIHWHLHCTPGRGGEREREEAVGRLRR